MNLWRLPFYNKIIYKNLFKIVKDGNFYEFFPYLASKTSKSDNLYDFCKYVVRHHEGFISFLTDSFNKFTAEKTKALKLLEYLGEEKVLTFETNAKIMFYTKIDMEEYTMVSDRMNEFLDLLDKFVKAKSEKHE